MRLGFFLTCCFCAVAGDALAADAPAAIPESVWQRGDDGSGIHQQTSLHCPVRAGAFRLTGLAAIDGFGTDVACVYDREEGDRITLYLTRAQGGEDFAVHLRISLESIIAVDPGAKPLSVPLPVFEMRQAVWLGGMFGYDDVPLRSGVWLTDLSGWTLKFRATHEAARERETLAVMGELARVVRASAAPHLAACAASAIPERAGMRIADSARIADIIALAAIDMAVSVVTPGRWCVEAPHTDGDARLMFWRDAAGDHDRVSLMTVDAPLIFESASQGDGIYRLAVPLEGKLVIVAFFDGRPSDEILMPVIRDAMAGTARPIGVFDPQSGTMEVPR
jgi:hypothetical protein